MGAVDSRLVEKRPGGAAASHSRAGWRPAAVHIPHHLGYPPVTSTAAALLSASFINSVSAVCLSTRLLLSSSLITSVSVSPPPCLISTSSSYYNSSPSDPSLDLAITLALQSLQQQNYLQAFIKHNFATALAHATSSTSLSKPYMSRRN